MKMRKLTYPVAQLLALAVLVAVVAWLPHVPSVAMAGASVAVWGVVAAAYGRAGNVTAVGRYWLLALTATLCVGVALNFNQLAASGQSPLLPQFGNFDMARYYYGATFISDMGEGYLDGRNALGYAVVIAGLWKLTGCTLLSPMMLNVLAALLTIVLTGVLTRRLLSGRCRRSDGWLMTAGMIASGSVCYLTFSGTLLMKESLTALSLAAAALSALRLRNGSPYKGFLVGASLYVVSCVAVGVLRPGWAIVPLAVLSVAFCGCGWRRRVAVGSVGVAAVAVCLCCESMMHHWYDVTFHIPDIDRLSDAFTSPSAGRDAYYTLLERIGYFSGPWWERVLWLPMTAAVQFLTPFPWNFTREISTSVTLAAVKFSYPWYALGGALLYYWGRCVRRSPHELSIITALATLFWLGFAWFCGGTVARYACNLVPMLVPAAVYAVALGAGTKGFRRWAVIYSIALVAALTSAYLIQHSKNLLQ